jgi:tellurium resistance protein TerD
MRREHLLCSGMDAATRRKIAMVKSKVKHVTLDGKVTGLAGVFSLGEVGAKENDQVVIGVDYVLKKIKSAQKFSRDAVALRKNEIDPSLQAFVLGEDGKVVSEAGFVYYGQPKFQDGVLDLATQREFMRHNSQLKLNLNALSQHANRVRLVATIDKAAERQHHAGMFLCVVFMICRQDMKPITVNAYSELGLGQQGVIFGDLCLVDGKWQFEPNGVTSEGGLPALCAEYGVDIVEEVEDGKGE